MDGFSGKRALNGLDVSKKSSSLVLRDTVNNRDRNPQVCSRSGCSSRRNSTKGTQIGCSEKAKFSRPSFRSSSSGKEIIGSSSRTCAAVSNARKSSTNTRKKLPSQLEIDSSETSSVNDEPDVSELIPPPGKIQRGLHHPESQDSDSREVILMEEGSSSVAVNTRPRRSFHQRSGLGGRDAFVGSSVSLGSRKASQVTSANAGRHHLRNLRCNSIPDVTPSSSCSITDSSLRRRKDIIKKRNSDGESSSSSRGKKTSEPSSELRNPSSDNGVSIYDSRQARNWPPNRDNGVASVRTRRATNSNNRARLSNQGNGNSLAPSGSPVVIPRVPESDIAIDLNAPTSSPQFSAETLSGHSSSYSRPGSSSGGLQGIMPGSPSEVGISRYLINHDNFGQYSIDGIAEVLLALERIEQDEELSYEQLLVLETNLLLNGLNFYDQHRDMRLDIDNMSYEELLALEERMGTVSTALTEEAISKCLHMSIYQFAPLKDESLSCSGDGDDDIKCSICQEEYVVGDEVGKLYCQHVYHVLCIQQWLRLKNWCPICKSSAESSSSSAVSS